MDIYNTAFTAVSYSPLFEQRYSFLLPRLDTYNRRKIDRIEVNAKCRHLKNWPVKGVFEMTTFCIAFCQLYFNAYNIASKVGSYSPLLLKFGFKQHCFLNLYTVHIHLCHRSLDLQETATTVDTYTYSSLLLHLEYLLTFLLLYNSYIVTPFSMTGISTTLLPK